VGKHLVPDTRIKAVMFTGSTETGAVIAKTLAKRSDAPVPLIAETGGQNCMLVDSTALPEQVVDDVITSGFQSAGQRCSALRVLFLQEDIYRTGHRRAGAGQTTGSCAVHE
jgi:RHH-type proline utilization regulon transcriptional repressor/proline dehydrogenase/delta 1-pyrroline-5-carboxylate dehydrogenase